MKRNVSSGYHSCDNERTKKYRVHDVRDDEKNKGNPSPGASRNSHEKKYGG
jgi:hypothetical protein